MIRAPLSYVSCKANIYPFTLITPRWVLRDACGGPTKEVWPYVPLDPTAIDHLRKGEPFKVAACWNGVAVFDASWFLSSKLLTHAASTKYSPCSSFALADSTKGTHAPDKPPLPLQFRESHECTSSECLLIALDMNLWTSPNRPKIYINPQVNVGAFNCLSSLISALTYLCLSPVEPTSR